MFKSATSKIALVTSVLLFVSSAAAQPFEGSAMWPASPTAVPAPDRFFFLLFTSQDILKAPRATHTWAVMVRTQDGRILDAPSISWMPADLKIKPLYLFVEPARNLSYDFTIQWTRNATRERISLWGPYEADPQLYERFLARKAVLESGALGYQCLDFLGEAAAQGNGVNCIHALTPVHGLAPGDVLQRYGNDSGRFISQTLVRRKMVAPYSAHHEWLISALGIDGASLDRPSQLQVPSSAGHRGVVTTH